MRWTYLSKCGVGMALSVLVSLFLAAGCESVDQDLGVDMPTEEQGEDPASDGIDNDQDGTIDEPGESAVPTAGAPGDQRPAGTAVESPTSDGVDNDGDGTIDEPDEAY